MQIETSLLARTTHEQLAGMTIRSAIETDEYVVLVFSDSSYAVIKGEEDDGHASASFDYSPGDIKNLLNTSELMEAGLINQEQAKLIDDGKRKAKMDRLKARAEQAQRDYEREVEGARKIRDRKLETLKQENNKP